MMMLIIAHHYIVNSGVRPIIQAEPLSFKSMFAFIFGAWGKIGINVFVLITAYFMCKSTISLRKFVKLFSMIMFYRIVISLILWGTGAGELSFRTIAEAFVPIWFVGKGFDDCFLIFYLCIPFLNILVAHINEKQHIQIIGIGLFTYTLFETVPITFVNMNYVSWFIVLFFIGSYFRFYPKPLLKNKRFWIVSTIVMVIADILSVAAISFFAQSRWGKIQYEYYLVSDSNSLFAVLTGISLFMLFQNLNIKTNPLINGIAASTFGVLNIHANGTMMRKWLWKDLLNNEAAYAEPYFYAHAVLSVIGIFIVCTVIDRLRIRLLEKPFLSWFDKNSEKINGFMTALEHRFLQ